MKTDHELVEKVKEGDSMAFREIVERNKKNIYYLSKSLTGDHHDAEDLSQEVFLKAFKSINTYKGDSPLANWLSRITINSYIDGYRRKSRMILKKSTAIEENIFPGADYQLLENNNPESRLSKLQIEHNINRALKCVTPMEKAVIVLRFFSELKIHEVAKFLSVSQSTVKTLLYRALNKLQEELVLKDRPYLKEDS